MKQLLIAIKITLVFALVCGIVYPLLVTGLAKVLFPHQANGSLIQAGGKTIGSELIGQRFTKPEYFHGRPSAAGNDGYDGPLLRLEPRPHQPETGRPRGRRPENRPRR